MKFVDDKTARHFEVDYSSLEMAIILGGDFRSAYDSHVREVKPALWLGRLGKVVAYVSALQAGIFVSFAKPAPKDDLRFKTGMPPAAVLTISGQDFLASVPGSYKPVRQARFHKVRHDGLVEACRNPDRDGTLGATGPDRGTCITVAPAWEIGNFLQDVRLQVLNAEAAMVLES